MFQRSKWIICQVIDTMHEISKKHHMITNYLDHMITTQVCKLFKLRLAYTLCDL